MVLVISNPCPIPKDLGTIIHLQRCHLSIDGSCWRSRLYSISDDGSEKVPRNQQLNQKRGPKHKPVTMSTFFWRGFGRYVFTLLALCEHVKVLTSFQTCHTHEEMTKWSQAFSNCAITGPIVEIFLAFNLCDSSFWPQQWKSMSTEMYRCEDQAYESFGVAGWGRQGGVSWGRSCLWRGGFTVLLGTRKYEFLRIYNIHTVCICVFSLK